MGINYSIDKETQVVRLSYVGEGDNDEFKATMRAILRSPEYRPGFGFLISRKSIEVPAYDYVDRLLAFTILQREALTGSRFALVVDRPDSYGKQRMAQAASPVSPIRIAAFQQTKDAERWLRMSDPEK